MRVSRKNNYYVRCNAAANRLYFCNEASYPEQYFPDEKYRLLGLFRIWNIVNYFYPYRYMLKDWDSVLYAFIPQVLNSSSPAEYALTLTKLLSQLEDSHSDLMWPEALEVLSWGKKYYPPFQVRMIQDELVVTDIFEPGKIGRNVFQLGDVVIKRSDMISFKEYRDSFEKDIRLSNPSYTGYTIANNYVFPSSDSLVSFTIIRKGVYQTISVRYIPFKDWFEAETAYFNGPANLLDGLARTWPI